MNAGNWLERPLPVWLRGVLIAVCALVPTFFVVRIYQHQHDFTPLLFFGHAFEPGALPEIRALHPEVQPGPGYDGQFYAQMALDPTLQRPQYLTALDNPPYRGQRIFLPALAWLLGAGRPRFVISIYALLNLVFFYALLAAVTRRLPAPSGRSYFVLLAIMLGSGALTSVRYALTDLPCATFGFVALAQGEIPGAVLISLSILTKPTGILFLARELAPFPCTVRAGLARAGKGLLVLVPFVLWQIYLSRLFGPPVISSQFTWPLAGWWHQVLGLANAVPGPWSGQGWIATGARVLEILALVSIFIQFLFIVARPRWRDPLWLVGFCFAVVFVFMNDRNFASAADYTRSLLPMTIAFNFALLELRSARVFLALYLAGGMGMISGLADMIFISYQ